MISTSKLNVRYAETDQMGIVHHSVYAVWYEVARTDFCKAAGLPYKEMEKAGVLTPLVSLNCKFIKPAFYDDTLEIKTRISKLTPARVEFSYEVYRFPDENPISTGTTMHALVNKDLHPINTKKVHPDVYAIMQNSME